MYYCTVIAIQQINLMYNVHALVYFNLIIYEPLTYVYLLIDTKGEEGGPNKHV